MMSIYNIIHIKGLGAMQVLLTKIPIKTEKQALKIIAIGKSKGLLTVGKEPI